ncbi:hypothetical protein QTP88_017095 [Uroleucon formosanum]
MQRAFDGGSGGGGGYMGYIVKLRQSTPAGPQEKEKGEGRRGRGRREGEGVGRRVRNSNTTYICAETSEKFRRDRFSDKRKIFQASVRNNQRRRKRVRSKTLISFTRTEDEKTRSLRAGTLDIRCTDARERVYIPKPIMCNIYDAMKAD